MRIAFLLSKWPVDGGIETVSRILANEFVNRGYRIYVLYTEYSCPKENGPFVDPRIVDRLIPYSKEKTDFVTAARDYVNNVVLDEEIDVVINQCFPTWTADILSDLRGKIKIIECLHMTLFFPSSYSRLRWKGYDLKMRLCGPWIYRHFQKKWRCEALMREFPYVDRFVFLSSSYVKEFLQFTGYDNSGGKVTYINNPLSLSAHNSKEGLIEHKENAVLCVARLSEMEKRISYMLEVWKGIEEDGQLDGWRFDIVGDGPSTGDYMRMASELGLKRVIFHGYQNPEPYYERSKISLMTSVAEGWGMTIVESQYYGVVPLVMNTFSSVYDIIDNGVNGIIVPNSKRKFLKRLKEVMIREDMREKMARAAMMSSGRFNVERIVNQWEKLIEGIKMP